MNKRKLLSLLLVLAMVFTLLPAPAAFAEGEDDAPIEASTPAPADENTDPAEDGNTDPSDPVEGTEAPAEEKKEEPSEPSAEEQPAEEQPAEEQSKADEPSTLAGETKVEEADTLEEYDGTLTQLSTGVTQPFMPESSANVHYRIPAIVTLDNGTLVAAADLRNKAWKTPDDCRDIDTVLAISEDKGGSWNTYLLNDTGVNAPTGDSFGSGTYIDPALATDGETIYMIVDLFPGTTTTSNSSQVASSGTSVNNDGNLLLKAPNDSAYNYYLADGKIYSTAGVEQTDYTVDAYFNLYKGNSLKGNLFDLSSDYFQPLMTSYLVFRKSEDGGKTWSAPQLINGEVKNSDEKYFIVSPGKAMVTSDDKIVFPCYNSTGTYLIYSTDGGESWNRSKSVLSGASEGELVELPDGTLRFFFRHSENDATADKLLYADASWSTTGDYTWGNKVNTGVATQDNVDLGALIYSRKTADGEKVILVSTSIDTTSAYSRKNGRIFTFTLDDNYNMSLKKTFEVNNSAFSYSCMTELADGSIGMLYENGDSGSITYVTYDIATVTGLSFAESSATEETKKVEDSTTGVTATAPGLTSIEVNAQDAQTTTENGKTTVSKTYSITLKANDEPYTGEATVTIPYDNAFDSCTSFYGTVDGTDDQNNKVTVTLDANRTTFTCEVPHFSNVTVYATKTTAEKTTTVELTVGETKTETIDGSNFENDNRNTSPDTNIATVDVSGSNANNTEPAKLTNLTSGNTCIIGNGNNWIKLNGSSITMTNDASEATVWTVGTAQGGGGQQGTRYTFKSDGYYLIHSQNRGSYSLNASTNSNDNTWSYAQNSGIYYAASRGYQQQQYYITSSNSSWTLSTSSNSAAYAYSVPSSTVASTTVTFTGVASGETSVIVGNTQYNITVKAKEAEKTVNVQPGKSITLDARSVLGWSNRDDLTVSYVLTDGSSYGSLSDKTFTAGSAEGTATVTATVTKGDKTWGTVTYTVNVKDTPTSTGTNAITSANSINNSNTIIAAGDPVTGLMLSYSATSSTSFKVAGTNVTEWKSLDTSIATVNTDGTITATGVGETYVIAAFSDGTTTVLPVRVVDGNTQSQSRLFTIYVDELYHSELYCAVISGLNKDTDWMQLPKGYMVYADLDYQYNSGILFAAKPEVGYAITYIGHSTNNSSVSSGTFNYIGNVNGTYGSGSTSSSEIYYYYDYAKGESNPVVDASATSNEALTGSKGIILLNDFEALLNKAVAMGLDAGFHYSRQGTAGTCGVQFQVISDRLPTFDKKITKVNDVEYDEKTTEVKINDLITYTLTITTYKTHSSTYSNSNNNNALSGTIEYSDVNVKDGLTGLDQAVSLAKSVTCGTIVAQEGDVVSATKTITTTLTLTPENFGEVVKDGKITNTAELTYGFKSNYGQGTKKADASASASVTITVPSYVIDFGLPLEIDLSNIVGNMGYSITGATIGGVASDEATTQNNTLTFTPKSVLPEDGVTINLGLKKTNDTGTGNYAIKVYPASNVLYEENFFTTTDTESWNIVKGTDNQHSGSQQAQESGEPKDDTYVFGYDTAYSSATGSQGVYKAENLSGTGMTGPLETSFYGNAFDLIGTCGPNTGRIMMIISSETTTKIVIAETHHSTEIHQVPLAHVELGTDDTYNVKVYASAPYNSSSDKNYYVAIDSFRVYRDSNNDAYPDSEKGVTYKNIIDVMGDTVITAYVDKETNEVTTKASKYEAAAGPQNEVYLKKDQAIAFKLTGASSVDVSVRAVSTAADEYTSNTEMYYTFTAENGVVTIKNTKDSMIAIGNIKLPKNASVEGYSTENEAALFAAVRMAFASALYDPITNVSLKSVNALRNKLVTLTVTTDTDVKTLTVNGKTLRPTNALAVKRGWSSEYIYVYADTVRKGETKDYTITATNADGLTASQTVQG